MENLKVFLMFLIGVLFLSIPELCFAEVKKEFYPSGKLKTEQNYINEKLDGTGKGYYESGKLEWEENYKNGKLDGIARGYYETGKLQAEVNFKNGKKHGTLTVYSERGKIQYVETYKNGEMIDRKNYDESDKLEIDYGVSLFF